MREAWRLQKHGLEAKISEQEQLHLFIIYLDATLPKGELIKETLAQGLARIGGLENPMPKNKSAL